MNYNFDHSQSVKLAFEKLMNVEEFVQNKMKHDEYFGDRAHAWFVLDTNTLLRCASGDYDNIDIVYLLEMFVAVAKKNQHNDTAHIFKHKKDKNTFYVWFALSDKTLINHIKQTLHSVLNDYFAYELSSKQTT